MSSVDLMASRSQMSVCVGFGVNGRLGDCTSDSCLVSRAANYESFAKQQLLMNLRNSFEDIS